MCREPNPEGVDPTPSAGAMVAWCADGVGRDAMVRKWPRVGRLELAPGCWSVIAWLWLCFGRLRSARSGVVDMRV
jgi:hypothetical protein